MIRLLASCLALGLVVAACGTSPGDPAAAPETATDTDSAELVEVGEGLTAVATVFPLAWIATQIAPGADVAFLGSRGQDPHDLEMSPADRELIESADVLLYMGDLDFQPQVEQAALDARGAVVDVAAIAAGRLRDFDHAHDDDEDEDDHAHDDEDDHAHDDEAFDPHVWFDGHVMAEVAEEAGAMFAAADPDNANDYQANATTVAEDLRDLEDDIDGLLTDCRHDTAIVSHEAYAYLLEPRRLAQEGITGAGGHSEASPQRLAELTERIQATGVRAVATEPIEGRADAEALADEAGVDLVEINPLEVVTDEEFAVGYVELLRNQAEAFAAVLDCG